MSLVSPCSSSKNFVLVYSPRTEYNFKLDEEEDYYQELKQSFDPITIKIIKKHFKERLGALKKQEMVAILKNHLLGFLPGERRRSKLLVRLLSRLFGDIDLNDNGDLEWNEFTNYIIHIGGKGGKKKGEDDVSYRLRFYSESGAKIGKNEVEEKVNYSFFLPKLNLLGLVEDGKSVIKFFDPNGRRAKMSIDIKETVRLCEIAEFSRLSERSRKELIREDEERRKKKKKFVGGEKEKKENYFRQENKTQFIVSSDSLPSFRAEKHLTPLCCVFLSDCDILLVSATNKSIAAWKIIRGEAKNINVVGNINSSSSSFSEIPLIITKEPVYAMAWDSDRRRLYTGTKSAKIESWSLMRSFPESGEELTARFADLEGDDEKKEQKKKKKKKKKNENFPLVSSSSMSVSAGERKKTIFPSSFFSSSSVSVTFLLVLKKLQILAASYDNGYILLWDPLLRECRKKYVDQKGGGVYMMAYDSIKNLLFSCGFSHYIYVYDPYIDTNCVYKLEGHSTIINCVAVNEKENELISLDVYGNIKIWDTNNLINFQTIKLNEEFESLSEFKKMKANSGVKMVYINKQKKIFVYGLHKLTFFETNRNNCPNLADDQVICSCYYDKTTKNLLSFCLRKIKFWSILTGKINKIYDDPMSSEMTAIAVDRPCKRAYLGDNNGKIKNINLKNGTLLKELESHNTEIKFLLHSMDLNIIVSCSNDNVIKIHDDKELLESEVIKELRIKDFNIKSLCIINRFSRLGIGLDNGIVKFYDIEHFHYDSDLELLEGKLDEVSAISEIKDIELVLVCFSSGKCKIIVSPPSSAKNNIIYQFVNVYDNNKYPVVCIEFDIYNHIVFLGDNMGHIACYDIADLYKIKDEIEENNQGVKNFDAEPIISKENLHMFNSSKISFLWCVEAHKEAIRHIHYINIVPRIIVTTSHDLRIKIFSADNGSYKDEFKQNSNRVKPVPIGIKYYVMNPFGEDKAENEEKMFYRKDIIKFVPHPQENSSQHIGEVAKSITEYNAKEKLYFACKNCNLPPNMSNDWLLDVDINKLDEREEEEYLEMLNKVKDIEKITNATELILQEKSMYSEAYRPKYIEEMKDLNEIKELNRAIQERLRNVKLAISKANLNQSKMIDLTKKKTSQYFTRTNNNNSVINNSIINKFNNKNTNTNNNNRIMFKRLTKSRSGDDIISKNNNNEIYKESDKEQSEKSKIKKLSLLLRPKKQIVSSLPKIMNQNMMKIRMSSTLKKLFKNTNSLQILNEC